MSSMITGKSMAASIVNSTTVFRSCNDSIVKCRCRGKKGRFLRRLIHFLRIGARNHHTTYKFNDTWVFSYFDNRDPGRTGRQPGRDCGSGIRSFRSRGVMFTLPVIGHFANEGISTVQSDPSILGSGNYIQFGDF